MVEAKYPVERLVPEGNEARCDPCLDGLVTWWPSIRAGLEHQAEDHVGLQPPPTLWMTSAVRDG